MTKSTTINHIRHFLPVLLLTLLLATALFPNKTANAQTGTSSPIHPTFPLLDTNGQNVLDSGLPLSTMQTCGTCHDTDFIATHNFHATAGLDQFNTTPGNHPWDSSPGPFGRWDPILYRYLSPNASSPELVDLTTPEWIQWFVRHPGGGPATTSRLGLPLSSLTPSPTNVETASHNDTNQLTSWDWAQSGTVELNCFLCHTAEPNNDARIAALANGDFAAANTMTLLGTNIILTTTNDGWQWNPNVFTSDGALRPQFVTIQDPTTDNCGQCHGQTHTATTTPLTLDEYNLSNYTSWTTGQIMSPQDINLSGLNLADKNSLDRPWDVHLERVLDCNNCHFSLNNPIYFQEAVSERPDHLLFDPRRLDLGEYIHRPLHQIAKGQSAQSIQTPGLDNTLRPCQSCHTMDTTHEWLPYPEQHTSALACQTCHIPKLYAPALQYIDWTVLQADQQPVTAYRGLDTAELNPDALVTGYQPAILPQTMTNNNNKKQLAPFNLVTSWYWIVGDPAQPLPLRHLQATYFDENNQYHPDILTTFDQDNDGALSRTELNLDTTAKVDLIRDRLQALGLTNPRITGEIQPFSLNHNVATDDWVTRDCQTCHSQDSRLTTDFPLADRLPGGVTPPLNDHHNIIWAGSLTTNDQTLTFHPQPAAADFYIIGHHAVTWVDTIGALAFVTILLAILLHASLRWWTAPQTSEVSPNTPSNNPTLPKNLRGLPPSPSTQIYMYDVYERFWHWLQTAAILLLLFTGLIIHKPDIFGFLSFAYIVQIHNILAAILLLNAALALFYHLASGEIKQYLPQPRGFFGQAIIQLRYYLWGIFHDEPHPFEKTRQRKLNPLQQITYLAILNLLLPLQIITGAIMWGMQRWPDLTTQLGGLPFMAPFHTLIAWLFATFIVMHVYLTTTGATPLANIQAMMLGWETIEAEPTLGEQQ
ncbi:MAG TPA: cytochrome b/b6 domain-containing protein [Anaerolineae bacterium]|nr:cytochrome b/b6 domain-containing protein [Anaerolineae bacterium]